MVESLPDKEKIVDLYFTEMFTYKKLMRYFRGKYRYAELKQVIKDFIERGFIK